MSHIFGSIWDRFNRNALNDLSKNVEIQGKSIQDLVAEGQLTPYQYAQLIKTINETVDQDEFINLRLNTESSLENKRDKNIDIDLDDLSTRVIQAMAGDASFDLLSIPRDGSVTPEKTNFLINPGQAVTHYTETNTLIYNLSYGGYIVYRLPQSTRHSKFFETRPGASYTINRSAGGDRFNIVLIKEDLNEILEQGRGSDPDNVLYSWQGSFEGEAETHTVTVEDEGVFLFVQTNLESTDIPEIEFIEDRYYVPDTMLQTSPEKIYNDFNQEIEDIKNLVVGKDPAFNLYGNLHDLYRKHEVLGNYFPDPLNLPVVDFHQRFSDLVDDEELFKSTYLGEAEGGHPLYMYENVPPEYEVDFTADNASSNDGAPMKIPKIMITAGVHGYERSSSIALYYLFKELHENPNDDPIIELIKMNVHLIVIPIVCPSGFEGDTYGNINGKNINREFPPHSTPTESEAVLVDNIIQSNLDMDFFIDFHNINSAVRRTKLGFSLTNNEMFKTVINNMYRMIAREWQKEHSSFPQNKDYVWAHNSQSNLGTVAHYTEHVHGIPSVLVELPRKIEWIDGGMDHEPTSRLGVEYLVNTITGALRSKQ